MDYESPAPAGAGIAPSPPDDHSTDEEYESDRQLDGEEGEDDEDEAVSQETGDNDEGEDDVS
jgi:hypothetical protein